MSLYHSNKLMLYIYLYNNLLAYKVNNSIWHDFNLSDFISNLNLNYLEKKKN